jgi:hypothetical protein
LPPEAYNARVDAVGSGYRSETTTEAKPLPDYNAPEDRCDTPSGLQVDFLVLQAVPKPLDEDAVSNQRLRPSMLIRTSPVLFSR